MNEWLRDFEQFLRLEETPPRTTSDAILTTVKSDLCPRPASVAAKVFALHAVAASVVALFCPQLGVGPIFGGHGIMHLFMQYGELWCAALCGSFFLGTSTLLATLLLRREELRVAAQHGFVAATLLASLTFGALMLAGGSGGRLALLCWIAGAVVSSWTILRAGAWIRLGRRAMHAAR